MLAPKSANVVVRANDFRPARLDALWLASNGLFSPAELAEAENKIFAPVVAALRTDLISLFVTDDRLQVTARDASEPAVDRAMAIGSALVKALPQDVNPTSAGINSVWECGMEGGEAFSPDILRSLFLPEGSPLVAHFPDASSAFGSYVEREFGVFRVHLTIKPQQDTDGDGPTTALQCQFDFHHVPGSENARADVVEALAGWRGTWEFSEEVARSLVEGAHGR